MSSLTIDWLHVIVLLGALQGVFLAGVLATKRRNGTANRLLAVLMLSFSIYLASAVYHAADLVEVFPHFFGLGHPQVFVFGPLIYLYAVSAADRSRRLTWRDAFHFVPFVVTVVMGLPLYFSSGSEKVVFYHRIQSGDIPLQLAIVNQLKLVSGVIYSALTVAFLRRHRERVKASYSSTEHVNLKWLLWLGAAAAAIWLLAVTVEVLESADIMRVRRGDDFIALAVAALVYGIGYLGLRQQEVFRYETAEYPIPTADIRADIEPGITADKEAGTPRYERSGLTDRQAERLKNALVDIMDRERPWQDSGLTLADLAARLSTTPHKLSEVLNLLVGQTFYDFVNGYRVREVQRRIAAGEAQRVKILSLALDAGFASKSTFNVVFKKVTSQTPSDYRQAAGA